jgi:hypothetical protein
MNDSDLLIINGITYKKVDSEIKATVNRREVIIKTGTMGGIYDPKLGCINYKDLGVNSYMAIEMCEGDRILNKAEFEAIWRKFTKGSGYHTLNLYDACKMMGFK